MTTPNKLAHLPTVRPVSPVPPTVGRIVHYGLTPMAAIIVGVNRPSGSVNLRAWTQDGNGEFVVNDVHYSPTPEHKHWTWPPRPELDAGL